MNPRKVKTLRLGRNSVVSRYVSSRRNDSTRLRQERLIIMLEQAWYGGLRSQSVDGIALCKSGIEESDPPQLPLKFQILHIRRNQLLPGTSRGQLRLRLYGSRGRNKILSLL